MQVELHDRLSTEADSSVTVILTDGGATFGATPAIPGTSVVSLAYDPNDLSIVYAGTNEGLFQNTYGGATFNSFFLTFCDIEAIVADGTTNPSTFYLASGSNPYRGHHDQLFRRAPFLRALAEFLFARDRFQHLTADGVCRIRRRRYLRQYKSRGVVQRDQSLQSARADNAGINNAFRRVSDKFPENDATLSEINPAGTAFTFSTYLSTGCEPGRGVRRRDRAQRHNYSCRRPDCDIQLPGRAFARRLAKCCSRSHRRLPRSLRPADVRGRNGAASAAANRRLQRQVGRHSRRRFTYS
jgi:hypothetical protein